MAGWTIDIKYTRAWLACAPYTSKIIKAGALLADTKTLLSHWNAGTSVQENLYRLRRENVFGKASRSRVEDVLAIFRQRYLTEISVTQALVVLVQHRFPALSLDRILYFHAAGLTASSTTSSRHYSCHYKRVVSRTWMWSR
jgi:hypothetical protein